MRSLQKLAIAALLVGSATAIGGATPASAQISLSIGIGGGDYNYYRPCSWYRYHDFPAPKRCYRYFQGYYPNLFVDGDFVFRDQEDFGRWRDRDDYKHWRNHEFRHQEWGRGGHGAHQDNGGHGSGDQGSQGDHQHNGDHGNNGGRNDNGPQQDNANHRDNANHHDNGAQQDNANHRDNRGHNDHGDHQGNGDQPH